MSKKYKYLKSITKMTPQEFRSIQEAYVEVVESQQLNEISNRKVADVGRRRQANVDKSMNSDEYISDKPGATQKLATDISKLNRFKNLQKKRDRRINKESYDLILSHLLDEGYAETPEAAEAIMVNMSEEWREDIIEARKKVKIDTNKPIRYKIADIGPGGKEYNVKTGTSK